jgi:hypothetical protein
MRLRVLTVALLGLACRSSTDPSRALHIDLTLNDVKSGSFSCHGGLFFSTRATNVSKDAVEIQGLTLRFNATGGSCMPQVAPIDSSGHYTIREGVTVEVRRIDLAGQLCESAGAIPGCTWVATADVTSDTGPASDQITFTTY